MPCTSPLAVSNVVHQAFVDALRQRLEIFATVTATSLGKYYGCVFVVIAAASTSEFVVGQLLRFAPDPVQNEHHLVHLNLQQPQLPRSVAGAH